MIVLLLLLLFGAVLFAERCKNVPTKTTKISAVEKEMLPSRSRELRFLKAHVAHEKPHEYLESFTQSTHDVCTSSIIYCSLNMTYGLLFHRKVYILLAKYHIFFSSKLRIAHTVLENDVMSSCNEKKQRINLWHGFHFVNMRQTHTVYVYLLLPR